MTTQLQLLATRRAQLAELRAELRMLRDKDRPVEAVAAVEALIAQALVDLRKYRSGVPADAAELDERRHQHHLSRWYPGEPWPPK